jgi:magnesium transporter|tara:strand:- start:232 stop:1146 length:915 start_codon:yes stop_codon:yes gene_type:complete
MEKIESKEFTWYHFDDNNEDVVKHLKKQFDFHELDIEDVASGPQQPKADFYKDYLFAIFHFPDYQSEEHRIHVIEMDVFLSKNFLITVFKGNNTRITDILENIRSDNEYKKEMMDEGASFLLYKIIDALTDNCWPVVRKISTQINDVEDEIYSEDKHKKTVWQIALIRRNLIRLKRILNPQMIVVSTLVNTDKPYFKKVLSDYFDDIRDTLSRMQGIVSGYFDTMDTLDNVNESLISARTNQVIKFLTVISVSLLPLTLLTGIYGMNIDGLPFSSDPNMVWMVFGGLFIFIFILLIFSRKRDWL